MSSRNAPDRPGRTGVRAGADLVVGPVPPTARLAGLVLVLAGVVGAVAPFPTYLVIGGSELVLATGPGAVLVALLSPAAGLAVGALLVAGRVPKFGLAYAVVSAAVGLGSLLLELYRGSGSTSRPGIEVIAGERVLTSSVEMGAGWVLGVVALALGVLAGVLAVAAWGRTVMDDAGALDPLRSVLAGAAALLGVVTVLSLALPAADVPDALVTDPATGLQVVVEQEGPQALLERPGLALLGGLVLAGAVLLSSVLAPTLRPRLAAVGGLAAVTVPVVSAGWAGVRDAAGSPDLEWTLPGAVLLACGLGYAVLTVVAWRVRRS